MKTKEIEWILHYDTFEKEEKEEEVNRIKEGKRGKKRHRAKGSWVERLELE